MPAASAAPRCAASNPSKNLHGLLTDLALLPPSPLALVNPHTGPIRFLQSVARSLRPPTRYAPRRPCNRRPFPGSPPIDGSGLVIQLGGDWLSTARQP